MFTKTVVFAIDDKQGLSFNNRRQSKDREIIKDICDHFDGHILVSSYSFPLFREANANVMVEDNPEGILQRNVEGNFFYFYEKGNLEYILSKMTRIIIYKWNKCYPRDNVLDFDFAANGFTLKETYDFPGYSHEKITKEVYVKE